MRTLQLQFVNADVIIEGNTVMSTMPLTLKVSSFSHMDVYMYKCDRIYDMYFSNGVLYINATEALKTIQVNNDIVIDLNNSKKLPYRYEYNIEHINYTSLLSDNSKVNILNIKRDEVNLSSHNNGVLIGNIMEMREADLYTFAGGSIHLSNSSFEKLRIFPADKGEMIFKNIVSNKCVIDSEEDDRLCGKIVCNDLKLIGDLPKTLEIVKTKNDKKEQK